VRVVGVSPGPIMTDMQVGSGGAAEQVGVPIDEWIADTNSEVPLGRFGLPSEVAATIVVLLSKRLGYITGADIEVGGGLGIG